MSLLIAHFRLISEFNICYLETYHAFLPLQGIHKLWICRYWFIGNESCAFVIQPCCLTHSSRERKAIDFSFPVFHILLWSRKKLVMNCYNILFNAYIKSLCWKFSPVNVSRMVSYKLCLHQSVVLWHAEVFLTSTMGIRNFTIILTSWAFLPHSVIIWELISLCKTTNEQKV